MATTTTTTETTTGTATNSAAAAAGGFRAVGKVLAVEADAVVFQPAGTTYEWSLATPGGRYEGPVGARVDCVLRVAARKLYSVPSGGAFVQPIFGPPKIIQGRIRHLDEREMVVQAGAPFVVELPGDPSAYDMAEGYLSVGAMVNVAALPGARAEFAAGPAPAEATR